MAPSPAGMDRDDRERVAGRVLAGLFVFTLLAHAAGYLASPASDGFASGDGYLRVMRVEQLLRTGAWFDNAIPRLNAPYGDISHWTRPLDVLIAILSAPLIPILGLRDAVFWGGALSNPLLHAGATVAMAWAALPLVGRRAAALAAIISVAQPAVFLYSGPRQVDHHALLIGLTAIGLGLMIRALDRRPSSSRWALGAGLVSAALIWVGIEATVFLVLCLSGLGLSWVADNDDPDAEKLFMFVRGLAGGLIAAVLVERGPFGIGQVEYDRLSIVHVGIGVLIFGGIGAMRLIGRARPWGGSAGKILGGVVCAAAALGGWLWLFPDAARGPMAGVHPDVRFMVYDSIVEYESALDPERFPALLGGTLMALSYLAWRAPALLADPRRWTWAFLLLCILVYAGLSAVWVRWSVYVGLFPCMVLAEAVQRGVDRVQALNGSRFGRELISALIVATVIAGPLAAAAASKRIFGVDSAVAQQTRGSCRVKDLAAALNTPPWSDRSRIVLAGADHGPELVYRTTHRAVGSLYHRNAAGLIDTVIFFGAKEDGPARAVLSRRGVDLVAICPPLGNDGDRTSHEPGALYRRLVDGNPPPWLRRIDAPASTSAFRIYEVVSGADGR